MHGAQRAAIMTGGFLGPFAGQALAVILPEFAKSLDITLAQAAATMSFYLFPFAFVMLFSTRLTQRFSPTRVVTTAYVFTFGAALILVLTPSWPVFLIGFTIMGIANAFTTPVLQLILKHLTPPQQLGRVLGTYTAMQSLGILSAPLVAGVSVLASWRLIYVLVAIIAVAIVFIRLPYVPPPGINEPEETTDPINWLTTVTHMLSCYSIGFGVIGLAFVIALYVGDYFGLGSVGKGMVVLIGGLSAFIFSRKVGQAADQLGPQPVLLASIGVAILSLVLLPLLPSVWLIGVFWGLTVLAAQGGQTTINLLVLRSSNGHSILSTVQAFRYFGSATTPILLLPVYLASTTWAFWIPAIVLLCAINLQWITNHRNRIKQ